MLALIWVEIAVENNALAGNISNRAIFIFYGCHKVIGENIVVVIKMLN